MQIIFLPGTKCLRLAQYVNKCLVRHKKFGPARKILQSVKGQGMRGSCPNIYTMLLGLQCHELRKDWQSIVSMSQFIIQGISVTIIGIFGFAGNILSVIVLLQAKHFWLS